MKKGNNGCLFAVAFLIGFCCPLALLANAILSSGAAK